MRRAGGSGATRLLPGGRLGAWVTPDMLALIQSGGPLGIVVVVLALLLRGDLVPRWAHEDACNERDYWRELALKGTDLSKDALALAHRGPR